MTKRMNFRQRIAWLMVSFYLALTCSVMYYIFEISDKYNTFAVDHVEKYHANDSENAPRTSWVTFLWSAVWHVADIPLPIWMVLLVLPYLQVFCMLLACTKPEPKFSMAYLWPIYIYLRCRHVYAKWTSPSAGKAFNSPMSNGHLLIDT